MRDRMGLPMGDWKDAEEARREADARLATLPSLLRHAVRALEWPAAAPIASDIASSVPELAAEADAWACDSASGGWSNLALRLDGVAADRGSGELHRLADAVRLASMTAAEAAALPGLASRIASSLQAAKVQAAREGGSSEVLADVERLGIGWLALAADMPISSFAASRKAHLWAFEMGSELTEAIESVAELRQDGFGSENGLDADRLPASASPAGHVLVCPPVAQQGAAGVGMETLLACVAGKALPLAPTPDVTSMRRTLAREYPYAVPAIDSLLSPLMAARHVRLPPTLLVGPPGSGKSRLARRLSELLGIGLWRTDAGRADNSCFGGTDRRWATAEPCHPLLAVARSRLANPMVLVDELDKAGTGRQNGRLWDVLHNFLERETSSAYPDPQLHVELDLSHVSYVMTCNEIGGLPPSLIDRCRVIELPGPSARDMTSLLPSILDGVARDEGIDTRWVEPLSAEERAIVGRHWRGGSIRHLSRLVAAVVRTRARLAPSH